jgi:DNA modification methylase
VKPYYEHAGITIYHGDCREVLPSLEPVDLLLTDPPYGIGRDGSRESTGSHGGRKAYEFLGWDAEIPSRETFRAMFAASREQIVWGGNYFTAYLRPTMGWFVWDKGQRIDQSDGELAYTSFDKALRIFTLNRMAIAQDGAEHPAQKPEELMKWCMLQAGDEFQFILDPFMGSGTTLRAAKDLGRKAIGIEIEEKYCEIAAKRLSQEVLQF